MYLNDSASVNEDDRRRPGFSVCDSDGMKGAADVINWEKRNTSN